MFRFAVRFEQSLCSWGDQLRADIDTTDMFAGTRCPNPSDPDLSAPGAPGPFCFQCDGANDASDTTTDPVSSTPGSATCFETPIELREAIVEYLNDGSSTSTLAETYGWPIGNWCVSQIEDFSGLFSPGALQFTISRPELALPHSNFNEPLSGWDVSRGESFNYMFQDAVDFNQPLEWDMSNAKFTSYMFFNASSFNGDIRGWDVGQVRTHSFSRK